MRKHEAWIFLEPVDPDKLGIQDYRKIIQNPMDFGTIKENLKKHEYKSMRQFLQDVELVFRNCFLYNGEASQVSLMCKKVQEEYLTQCQQLNVDFYICDNIQDLDTNGEWMNLWRWELKNIIINIMAWWIE